MIGRYIVVRSDDLEALVNNVCEYHADRGYIPVGGVAVEVTETGVWYLQAMIQQPTLSFDGVEQLFGEEATPLEPDPGAQQRLMEFLANQSPVEDVLNGG